MKKFYLFLVTIIAASTINPASAQPVSFMQDVMISGFDYARAVTMLPNGNFAVAAEAISGLGNDVTLTEYTPDGSVVRSYVIPTAASVSVRSLIYTSDDHYMITGSMGSTPNDPNWMVARLDSAMDVIWLKQYGTQGSDYANNIFETPQGELIVTGTTALSGSAKPSVVKIDTNGDILSEGYLNTNQFASPWYRGFYAGENRIAFSRLAHAISIVDTTGNVIKDHPNRLGTYTENIAMLSDGSFALFGLAGLGAPTGSKVFFAVLDSTLNNVTTNIQFGTSGQEYEPAAMVVDDNDDIIIFINVMPLGAMMPQIIAIKLDVQGNVIWSNSYTPVGYANPQIHDVVTTPDDGFVMVGQVATALERMFVSRVDSTGFVPCNLLSVPSTSTQGSSNSWNPHVNFPGNTTDLGAVAITSAMVSAQENVICTTTGITDVADQLAVSITPTLVDDHFVITYDAPLTNLNLELIDVNGKLVLARQVNSGSQVSVEGLSAGMYFVRLFDMKQLVFLDKLFKD